MQHTIRANVRIDKACIANLHYLHWLTLTSLAKKNYLPLRLDSLVGVSKNLNLRGFQYHLDRSPQLYRSPQESGIQAVTA